MTMKRIQLSALAVLAVSQLFAQRVAQGGDRHVGIAPTFSAERTPTDTLVPPSFLLSQDLYFYDADNSGYVFGTNGYGDLEKLQAFVSSGSVNVEEVFVYFGAKSGAESTGFNLLVYPMNGAAGAPGAAAHTEALTLADVDTTMLTGIMLSTPVTVTGNFGVGINLAGLYSAGASLGILSSQTDAAGTTEGGTWERYDDNSWHTVFSGWGAKWDMAIFVVIDAGTASIGSLDRVNGVQMDILGGNPASSNVQLVYDLERSATTRLSVVDMKGARVFDMDLGRTMQGEHRQDLDVSSWPNGTYLITILADGMPLTKKFVVQH